MHSFQEQVLDLRFPISRSEFCTLGVHPRFRTIQGVPSFLEQHHDFPRYRRYDSNLGSKDLRSSFEFDSLCSYPTWLESLSISKNVSSSIMKHLGPNINMKEQTFSPPDQKVLDIKGLPLNLTRCGQAKALTVSKLIGKLIAAHLALSPGVRLFFWSLVKDIYSMGDPFPANDPRPSLDSSKHSPPCLKECSEAASEASIHGRLLCGRGVFYLSLNMAFSLKWLQLL